MTTFTGQETVVNITSISANTTLVDGSILYTVPAGRYAELTVLNHYTTTGSGVGYVEMGPSGNPLETYSFDTTTSNESKFPKVYQLESGGVFIQRNTGGPPSLAMRIYVFIKEFTNP